MHLRLLFVFFALSILLSIPSMLRIPRFFPFVSADVRAAFPEAQRTLEEQGLWLVNIDLLGVKKDETEICFLWGHRYTSGRGTARPEEIKTCVAKTQRVMVSPPNHGHTMSPFDELRVTPVTQRIQP